MIPMNKSIALPFLILMITGLSSCEDFPNHCVEGNGNRASETRDLLPFDQILVNGDFKVQVDTGAASSAVVQADDNLMGFIDTRVSNNRLIIESRNGGCLKPTHTIEIKVTTSSIGSMELNGSGYLYCFGLQTNELALRVNGSGQIECNQLQASSVTYQLEGSGSIFSGVTAEDLSARIDGSGEIRLSGTVASSDLRVIGSGRIQSGQLITGVCTAYISGSGTVDTYVNQALDVTINGSGIVYYDGNPTITSQISGSGKIIKH
jgi:hypothetical protein